MPPDAPAQWLESHAGLNQQDIHLGLDRVREVHQRLGAPRPAGRLIVIAGTNGKGSCVAFLDAILRSAGYSVGCYTSPHLVRLAERVQINGELVSEDALLQALKDVDNARDGTPLSYFEFVTLAAFLLMAERQLDVGLLEIGLGGRLDAVNILDADVAVITRIALDHQQRLGADREAIGREKAGILRHDGVAVCGDADPPASVLQQAATLKTSLAVAGRDFRCERGASDWHWHGPKRQRLSLPLPSLRGAHQFDNAATALMALEQLEDVLAVNQRAVRGGLLSARLPGRMTVVPGRPPWILDVAHNTDAVEALNRSLGQQFVPGQTHALLGMLQGRDVAACIGPLMDRVDHWHLTDLYDPRALTTAELRASLPSELTQQVSTHVSVQAGIEAIRQLTNEDDRILVFGSFVTVGEAMRELGV